YVGTVFLVHPPLKEIVGGLLHPRFTFNHDSLAILVAMIGTSLSAYLFTWQSNQEVEEKKAAGKVELRQRRGTTDQHLQKTLLDVVIGMFVSALVMYSIIVATAATLHTSGQVNIQTAADAAKALEPLAGHFASLLFAIGIIGTGLLAIPVLAGSAAYAVGEARGWKIGLDNMPWEAKGFYSVIG